MNRAFFTILFLYVCFLPVSGVEEATSVYFDEGYLILGDLKTNTLDTHYSSVCGGDSFRR